MIMKETNARCIRYSLEHIPNTRYSWRKIKKSIYDHMTKNMPTAHLALSGTCKVINHSLPSVLIFIKFIQGIVAKYVFWVDSW